MMYEPKEVGPDDANIVSGCQWCVVKDQRITQLEAQLAEAREEIARLKAGYAEAIEDIGDWALYASDYFREKHDLRVTLLKHKTTLAKAKEEER